MAYLDIHDYFIKQVKFALRREAFECVLLVGHRSREWILTRGIRKFPMKDECKWLLGE